MGVVNELIKEKMDINIRGALVRLSNNSLLKCAVNKLYPIEYVRRNLPEPADTGNLTRSRREAAEIGELRWKFTEWKMVEILIPNIWWEVSELLYENRCYYVIDIFYVLSNTCKYFLSHVILRCIPYESHIDVEEKNYWNKYTFWSYKSRSSILDKLGKMVIGL